MDISNRYTVSESSRYLKSPRFISDSVLSVNRDRRKGLVKFPTSLISLEWSHDFLKPTHWFCYYNSGVMSSLKMWRKLRDRLCNGILDQFQSKKITFEKFEFLTLAGGQFYNYYLCVRTLLHLHYYIITPVVDYCKLSDHYNTLVGLTNPMPQWAKQTL